MTRSAAPELLEHQRQIGKGDTHAAHDLHDLAVFRLQLLLLQFFKPRLLLGNFGLDLLNLGLDLCAFRNCHIKNLLYGSRP